MPPRHVVTTEMSQASPPNSFPTSETPQAARTMHSYVSQDLVHSVSQPSPFTPHQSYPQPTACIPDTSANGASYHRRSTRPHRQHTAIHTSLLDLKTQSRSPHSGHPPLTLQEVSSSSFADPAHIAAHNSCTSIPRWFLSSAGTCSNATKTLICSVAPTKSRSQYCQPYRHV